MARPGYNYKLIDDPIINKILSQQTCYDSYLHVSQQKLPLTPLGPDYNPRPCVLTNAAVGLGDKIKYFEVKPDDLYIVTYPKSGTTWAQEISWLIYKDLDYETAAKVHHEDRFPQIDFESIRMKGYESFDCHTTALELAAPRTIKSHFPVFLLPDQIWTVKPRVIHVIRNIKDTIVSCYHHYKLFHTFTGTMQEFIDAFVNDYIFYAPYLEHVLDYYRLKDEKNFLFLKFEDMKKDVKGVIKTIANFTNKTITDAEIDKLADHVSFDSMKKNSSCNKEQFIQKEKAPENASFIRKGEVGGWRNELTPEQIKQIDDWVMEKVPNEKDRSLFLY